MTLLTNEIYLISLYLLGNPVQIHHHHLKIIKKRKRKQNEKKEKNKFKEMKGRWKMKVALPFSMVNIW